MSWLDSDLFCRIYVDHHGPSEEIARLVSELVGAPVTRGNVVSDELDILIDHGDSYPPISARDYSQWINWKYSLEVHPVREGISAEAHAAPLKDLLQKLSESGVGAVPSCSFEDLLAPWNRVNA